MYLAQFHLSAPSAFARRLDLCAFYRRDTPHHQFSGPLTVSPFGFAHLKWPTSSIHSWASSISTRLTSRSWSVARVVVLLTFQNHVSVDLRLCRCGLSVQAELSTETSGYQLPPFLFRGLRKLVPPRTSSHEMIAHAFFTLQTSRSKIVESILLLHFAWSTLETCLDRVRSPKGSRTDSGPVCSQNICYNNDHPPRHRHSLGLVLSLQATTVTHEPRPWLSFRKALK